MSEDAPFHPPRRGPPTASRWIWIRGALLLCLLASSSAHAQFTGKRRAYASSFWSGTGASGKTISWGSLYVALPYLEDYRSAWRSAYHASTADTVWLNVNLGAPQAVRRVVVKWGSYVPTNYTLTAWTPGMNAWVPLATRTGAGGGTHVLSFTAGITEAQAAEAEASAGTSALAPLEASRRMEALPTTMSTILRARVHTLSCT